MRVGWQFDRGQAAVGEVVPIKCAFMVEDEQGTAASIQFTIPDDAAQEMLANLAKAARPPSELTIATQLPEHRSTQ